MRNVIPLTLGLFIILMSGLTTMSKASSVKEKPASLSGLPLLNAYASKHGTVKLRKDYNNGYYAIVDFQYLYSEDSDSEYVSTSSSTGAMMLGLYTSQTWLSNGCLGFSYYWCSINSCTQYTYNTLSENLPYFSASGYRAIANAYLDYSDWYLYQNAAITASCTSNSNGWYGQGRTGILGMGVASNGYYNFRSQRKFSIYIDPKVTYGVAGELTFNVDQDKIANPSSSGYTFTADTNWHVSMGYYSYIYFYGQSSNTLSMNNFNLIFDLSSPTIGLPYSIYTTFVSYFGKAAGVTCTSSLSNPICYYYGSINNLPTIQLYANSQYIAIPPQVYLQNGFSYDNDAYLSQVTLNIRALANNLTYTNYVTSDYSNYIILGSSFMTYYYTTFDYTSGYPRITLSIAATPGSGLTWLWITLGVAGLIAVIICCVCIAKAKKPKTGSKVGPTTNTFDAPLIANADAGNYQYNQAPPTYDNYSYGNNYNQQTYGYNYGQGSSQNN
jgi:hypothetical protein